MIRSLSFLALTAPERVAAGDSVAVRVDFRVEADIVFDPDRISACFVTAKFDRENLFERLDIICKVAGVHYVVSGAQIIISK